LQYLNIQPGGLAWLCLPANYIAGKMMIVRALVGNLDLFISKPESSPSIPTKNKIVLAAMVPSQISHMAAADNGFNAIEKSISHVLIGGATIPELIEDQLKQLTGSCLWHTYGMTETISHIAIRRMNGEDASPSFTPLPGVSVSQNNQGCLMIDYPSIGVANLHTNDLATLNSNNTFSIDGRNDFIINSGGIKLNPIKIERKLENKLPCSFFITGLPDPIRGEKAVLCMENKGDLLPKICNFWKIIENELQKPEIPQEIIFLDYFIRSENGKLKRQATSMLVNRRFE
jgi:O-succinylbenzoic acid--CoA ligase